MSTNLTHDSRPIGQEGRMSKRSSWKAQYQDLKRKVDLMQNPVKEKITGPHGQEIAIHHFAGEPSREQYEFLLEYIDLRLRRIAADRVKPDAPAVSDVTASNVLP